MANNGNNLKRWAVLSAIAIEMGAIIYLFVKGGQWLDSTYNPGGKAFLIVGTLLGICISLYLVIQQTNRLNK